MRHAAGELPDRLHLLRLAQLVLELLVARDVHAGAHHTQGLARRIALEASLRRQPDRIAVAVQRAELDVEDLAVHQRSVHRSLDTRAVVGMDRFHDLLGRELWTLALSTEQPE